MDQGASLRGALLRRLQGLRDPAVVMEAATSSKNASYQPHRLYLQVSKSVRNKGYTV